MAVTHTKRRFVKTRTPNLVKYLNNGEYYLLYKLNGKQIRTSLKTTNYKVAVNRRNEKMLVVEKQRQTVTPSRGDSAAPITIGDLCDEYAEKTRDDFTLTEKAKYARLSALKRLLKTYPDLREKKPNQLDLKNLLNWFTEFNLKGTNYVPKGAKKAITGNSFTSVKQTLHVFQKILDMAVVEGLAAENLIRTHSKIGYFKPMKKEVRKLTVPSKSEVKAVVHHLKDYWGGHYAFSIQLLAYSGCRIGEARALKWSHVKFEENKLEIPGFKTRSSNRIIHMSKTLRGLLEDAANKISKVTKGDQSSFFNERIMPIDCCNKQLTRACSELGIRRITNHDLRHYFGTSCLEADIPVSTVAAWMGHSDGGALLLKTYAHLRDRHSAHKAASLEL